jgi:UDP-glucose:glycoprotein glucosyltransferase
LSKTKTIDLCNNRQTKESKLAYAKRMIPEWTIYDKEINEHTVSDEL